MCQINGHLTFLSSTIISEELSDQAHDPSSVRGTNLSPGPHSEENGCQGMHKNAYVLGLNTAILRRRRSPVNKKVLQLGMVAHACKPSTSEVEAGGSPQAQGCPGLSAEFQAS